MSLDDGDLSPVVAHRRNREAVEAQHAADLERRRADVFERDELESPETMEALWDGVFRRSAAEREPVVYDERPGVDRRCFSVDGEVPEQQRRDREHHNVPGLAS